MSKRQHLQNARKKYNILKTGQIDNAGVTTTLRGQSLRLLVDGLLENLTKAGASIVALDPEVPQKHLEQAIDAAKRGDLAAIRTLQPKPS